MGVLLGEILDCNRRLKDALEDVRDRVPAKVMTNLADVLDEAIDLIRRAERLKNGGK